MKLLHKALLGQTFAIENFSRVNANTYTGVYKAFKNSDTLAVREAGILYRIFCPRLQFSWQWFSFAYC